MDRDQSTLRTTVPEQGEQAPGASASREQHGRCLALRLLARLAHERDWEDVHAIPVSAADTRPPIILHVIPVRGPATDLLPGAVAIVIAAPVVSRDIPSVAVLQGLFNMTPAEARVTRAVAQRRTIVETARGLELSQETVRSQLKAALAKTGFTRKLDLAVTLDERVPADRPGTKVNTLPPARERIPIG